MKCIEHLEWMDDLEVDEKVSLCILCNVEDGSLRSLELTWCEKDCPAYVS